MHRLVLAALLALVAACNSGSESRISATVQNITYPATITGDVVLHFAVVDDPESTVDVVIQVSRDDGRSWQPARIQGALTGLQATPSGTYHEVAWDSLGDAGFRMQRGVRMRMRAQNDAGRGAIAELRLPVADNRALAAHNVRDYFIHYGSFDAATEAVAKTYDLVILHPHNAHLGVDLVRRIQAGVDPDDPADDVLVLAYISIGEDLRTIGRTDAELLLDPRFVGDGTGPRVDMVPVLHQDAADVPASAGPDWRNVQIANDDDFLCLRFTSDDPFNLDGSPAYTYSRTLVFLDVDNDPTTGFAASDVVGSELLIAGDSLYVQESGVFNAGLVGALAVQPTTMVTDWEIAVPLTAIRAIAPNASRLRLRMVNDDVNDVAPDAGAVFYRLATQ